MSGLNLLIWQAVFGYPSMRNKGEVAEWLKAHAWKACIRVTVSGVRIPSSPQKC